MNESDFHRVENVLSESDSLDVDLEGGILDVTCPDGSRVIVNRQTPNREIWVAARSGGFHFTMREGEWRDTRSGEELMASLERIFALQAGENVSLK